MTYKVKFSIARIVRLYKAGKNVSQIAQALGYPAGTGNNRHAMRWLRRACTSPPNKVSSTILPGVSVGFFFLRISTRS